MEFVDAPRYPLAPQLSPDLQYQTVTPPMSYMIPNYLDWKVNEELEKYLNCNMVYDSSTGERKRILVINKLLDIVRSWVKMVCSSKGCSNEIIERFGNVQLKIFGSQKLGVQTPESDIDILCLAPCFTSRSDFFSSFCDLLQARDDVNMLSPVPEAYTPVVKFNLDGQAIDMIFVSLPNEMVPEPDSLNILDHKCLRGLDEQSVRSLNGLRVAEMILRLVPHREVFCTTLRAIKLWARQRGLYSNILGFLGGVNYAILVAFICQRFVNSCPATLVQMFFAIYSRWYFPNPVLLTPLIIPNNDHSNGSGSDIQKLLVSSWNPKVNPKDATHLMPIITPAFPYMNSSYNVGPPQFRAIKEEIDRVYALILEYHQLSSLASSSPTPIPLPPPPMPSLPSQHISIVGAEATMGGSSQQMYSQGTGHMMSSGSGSAPASTAPSEAHRSLNSSPAQMVISPVQPVQLPLPLPLPLPMSMQQHIQMQQQMQMPTSVRFPWEQIFEPAAKEFFRKYPRYVQVDVESSSAYHHRSWFGWCESRMRSLFLLLDRPPQMESHPYANCWHNCVDTTPVSSSRSVSSTQPGSSVNSSDQSENSGNSSDENVREPGGRSWSLHPANNHTHTSSFFVGLFWPDPSPRKSVDLGPEIYEFQRRVMSWPLIKPGMKLNIEIRTRSTLPKFVFDSEPAPSSTTGCTPVKRPSIVINDGHSSQGSQTSSPGRSSANILTENTLQNRESYHGGEGNDDSRRVGRNRALEGRDIDDFTQMFLNSSTISEPQYMRCRTNPLDGVDVGGNGSTSSNRPPSIASTNTITSADQLYNNNVKISSHVTQSSLSNYALQTAASAQHKSQHQPHHQQQHFSPSETQMTHPTQVRPRRTVHTTYNHINENMTGNETENTHFRGIRQVQVFAATAPQEYYTNDVPNYALNSVSEYRSQPIIYSSSYQQGGLIDSRRTNSHDSELEGHESSSYSGSSSNRVENSSQLQFTNNYPTNTQQFGGRLIENQRVNDFMNSQSSTNQSNNRNINMNSGHNMNERRYIQSHREDERPGSKR